MAPQCARGATHWSDGRIEWRAMEEIPKIAFLKRHKAKIEFEIFTLKNLFSRHDRQNLSLDKPHRVDFFQILFITEGTGTHYIDFRPYVFKEGSILFISKGQVHAFQVHPDRDGFLILFTEAFLSKNLIHSDILSFYRLYNYHLHLPIMQPEEIGTNAFDYIITEIYKAYHDADDFAKEEILRLLLKLLLLKAERIKHTLIPKEKKSEWFLRFGLFRRQLENHFHETRNAKTYADVMKISYKHLNEICKSVTGSTAKVFIDHFVILEIKRQLAMSDLSIKELTYQLGFDEPTNLVKFFKKHTRLSPSQFRQAIQK
jgi:AraC family transcriptional regulator, transcriptional activator of pobA